jgi:hypothetical protein
MGVILMNKASQRELSKRTFNSEHRVAVALALMGLEGRFDAAAAMTACIAPRSSVQKELAWMVFIGVLERFEEGRAVFYLKNDSFFWSFCGELSEQAFESPAPNL